MSTSSKQAITDWLVQRISELTNLPRGQVDPGAEFTSLGLDSLVLAGLCFDLGSWLGRPIDEGIIWEYTDIDALASHLATASP
jgi:phthiocerol/phenolphthiocerol synthesis type-I polyketide synthase D